MAVPLSESRPFVLIVDDNTDHVELIRTALASNYQVLTAFNGLDAYTIACRTPPSAIVLDLGAMLTKPSMPGEILAAVRRAISTRPPEKITG